MWESCCASYSICSAKFSVPARLSAVAALLFVLRKVSGTDQLKQVYLLGGGEV